MAADRDLEVLFTREQIASRIVELASEIRAAYGDEEILLVCVLKGSLYFTADLSRHLGGNVQIDFVQISSYHGRKSSSGVAQIRKDLDINIEDRNVLIVEDIVDTGVTLEHLVKLLETRKPKSLRIVALLSKPEARQCDVDIHYVGFCIANEFVVGYGLDFAERYRNLPYIAILREG